MAFTSFYLVMKQKDGLDNMRITIHQGVGYPFLPKTWVAPDPPNLDELYDYEEDNLLEDEIWWEAQKEKRGRINNEDE